MISSLSITGLRCFDTLDIPACRRVNLITGRNGVGKTTLLEALSLYADGCGWPALEAILKVRGERRHGRSLFDAARSYLVGGGADSRRRAPGGASIETPEFGRRSMTLGWSVFTTQGYQPAVQLDARPSSPTARHVYQLTDSGGEVVQVVAFSGGGIEGFAPVPRISSKCFVPLGGRTFEELELAWGPIEFTTAEDEVLELLRILEPRIERLSFRPVEGGGERFPAVKLRGQDGAVPVAALGEGTARLFGLVLAAFEARGGFLLVDELDTGLHTTLLGQVWDALFDLADRLDLQLFATTHSHDCVQALANAVRRRKATDMAQVIRLARRAGRVEAFRFAEVEEFVLIDENELEVR